MVNAVQKSRRGFSVPAVSGFYDFTCVEKNISPLKNGEKNIFKFLLLLVCLGFSRRLLFPMPVFRFSLFLEKTFEYCSYPLKSPAVSISGMNYMKREVSCLFAFVRFLWTIFKTV